MSAVTEFIHLVQEAPGTFFCLGIFLLVLIVIIKD